MWFRRLDRHVPREDFNRTVGLISQASRDSEAIRSQANAIPMVSPTPTALRVRENPTALRVRKIQQDELQLIVDWKARCLGECGALVARRRQAKAYRTLDVGHFGGWPTLRKLWLKSRLTSLSDDSFSFNVQSSKDQNQSPKSQDQSPGIKTPSHAHSSFDKLPATGNR